MYSDHHYHHHFNLHNIAGGHTDAHGTVFGQNHAPNPITVAQSYSLRQNAGVVKQACNDVQPFHAGLSGRLLMM